MEEVSYVFYTDEAFNDKEVLAALSAVAGGRAPGPDGVPADVFLYDKIRWGRYILLMANATAQGARSRFPGKGP